MSFDSLICLHTFHFLPDPVQAVREFYRLVRPGGCLVLIFEMDTWLRRLAIKIIGPVHKQFYFKIAEVENMVTAAGFHIWNTGTVLRLPMEAYRKLPMSRLQKTIDSSQHWPEMLATLGYVVGRKPN